jgi:NHL repeat
MRKTRWLLYAGAVTVAVIAGLWNPVRLKARSEEAPRFRVDPSWPNVLPAPVGYDLYKWPGCGPQGCQNTATPGGDNAAHRWVMGEVAGSCTDAQGNVYTYNRGWQVGALVGTPPTLAGNQSGAIVGQDASDFTSPTFNPDRAMPSPPVVAFDAKGRTFAGFGNPAINPATGRSAYMPNGAHGCFVDYQGYLWVAGNGDGIVQKYNPATAAGQGSHATFVLQIGTKDTCDSAGQPCTGAALNTSHTQLYNPPDLAVDPEVGPVSGTRGDIYIADGYGNYRVVVFNSQGLYVGQWGQSCGHNENADGSNPCPAGTFGANGGGHPHCVVLGNDGLVYVCDRPNNRIQVFKKTCAAPSVGTPPTQPFCAPDRVIRIEKFPGATAANRTVILRAGTRACDMDFWPNKDTLASLSPGQQKFILDVDLGNDNTWVIDKASGTTVGAVGRCGLAPCPGHNAAEFAFGHTVNVAPDNKTIYVAETITGRRIQKFVKVDDDEDGGKDKD